MASSEQTISSPYALLFPGQGSQKIGMGAALFEAYASAREVFEEADETLGEKLSSLCFTGDPAELALTANTQPAILTCSIAALRVFEARVVPQLGPPAICLGHSLGEFTALVAAGALEFADALKLVRIRGLAMQSAVPPGVGAMAAILGLPLDELESICVEVSVRASDEVAPANENGGGQVVVAGHAGAVSRVVDIARERGARAIPLQVSAPFHCSLMAPAAKRLAAALEEVRVHPLRVPVIANVDAAPYRDRALVVGKLVQQVTSRVRWEGSVQRLATLGIARGVEIGHGRVIAGLCRRIDRDLKIKGFGTPAQVESFAG
jgi:[acyl-carrier-protein] S-malonyltransferase